MKTHYRNINILINIILYLGPSSTTHYILYVITIPIEYRS